MRRDVSEPLDKSAVAELSADEIDSMTCEELVRVIRSAELSTMDPGDFERHLPLYSLETLKRLAHLARRCCQHQGY